MQEIWKNIKGFEGLYQISNLGRVKSLKRVVNYCKESKSRTKKHTVDEKIKKGTQKGNGYLHLSLYKNNIGYNRYIHRLVAEAFLPNPNNYKTVNHKNLNKKDNRVENLEWCSYLDNNMHARENICFKSGKKLKIEATKLNTNEKEIITDLLQWCKENKHDRASIYRVLSGRYSQHHGYKFKYLAD
jgi:hypothetical protein